MITQEKIDRSTPWPEAKTPEGLTAEETAERAALRQVCGRCGLIWKAQLDNTLIQEPDGTRHRLPKTFVRRGVPLGAAPVLSAGRLRTGRGRQQGGDGQEPSQSAMAPGAGGRHFRPASVRPGPEPPTQEELLQAMVDTMTPEEKAGQLFWVRFPETGWDELAREWHPGGFLLFGRDFKTAPRRSYALCSPPSRRPPHPPAPGGR